MMEAFSDYHSISHIDRLKLIECEFLACVSGNLTSVGLDDDTRDINIVKGEKANI